MAEEAFTWERAAYQFDHQGARWSGPAVQSLGNLLSALGQSGSHSVQNEEIAAKLDGAVPTVQRRLRLIRKLWSQRP